MNAVELLAELERRGITVRLTDDEHLRLTGPAEDAFTPELRRAVETARVGLLNLLAGEVEGSADATPVASVAAEAAAAPSAEASSGLPGWLLWAGVAIVVAIVLAAYAFGQTAGAPAAATAAAPPVPPGWPCGGQAWRW